MRPAAWIPVALLVTGAGLVVDAVARGGASVALVVVFPVVFGASTEFFFGAVLLFFGFVSLPLALGFTLVHEEEGAPLPGRGEAPPAEVGGLILIGPVPLFFGRSGRVSRRARIAVAVVGAALLVGLVLLLVGLR